MYGSGKVYCVNAFTTLSGCDLNMVRFSQVIKNEAGSAKCAGENFVALLNVHFFLFSFNL